MKKKIEDVEYEIIPIPPHLSPHNARISELLQKKPTSFENAEEISKEINQHIQKLLSETVIPKPRQAHITSVYNTLIDLTNTVLDEAKFFRKKPNISKSGANRLTNSETPK